MTRINNIPAPIKNTTGAWQFRRLPKHTAAGFPDIIAAKNSVVTLIEVKQLKGKLSPAQQECHRLLLEAGLPVLTARSIDDVIAAGL